jgi:hypothetical protein
LKLKSKLVAGASTLVMASSMIGFASPDAHAAVTQLGDCGGAVQLVKITSPVKGVGLGDQTTIGIKAAGNLAATLATGHPKVNGGGACEGGGDPNVHPVVRTGDPHVPQPTTKLTGKSEAISLLGNASCASGADAVAADANVANAWPLNGKITWTFNETYTDIISLGIKPYKMQADVSILGFSTDPATPDIVNVSGIVLTGTFVGAQVDGHVWEDPVAKTGGPTGYNTGYELDVSNALGCATADPGDANITQVLAGGGNVGGADSSTSLLNTLNVDGLHFQVGQPDATTTTT